MVLDSIPQISSHEFPTWLQVLLNEKFFNACLEHEDVKKHEKNILCIDCCLTICPHCISSLHISHRLLQIRRYMYNDVLKVEDCLKLMDCSLIQSYTTNSSKVVFINERPKSRQFRCSDNICITCDRNLQSPYIFCSLSCKINDIIIKPKKLSSFLRVCKFLHLTDESPTTTPTGSTRTSSGSTRTSSGSGCNVVGGDMFWCQALACTATTEFVTKKRRRSSLSTTRCRIITAATVSPTNRRKNKVAPPQRAPLY